MPYTGEAPAGAVAEPEMVLEPPPEGDYSMAANPEIFTGYYTREAYNAAYEVLTAARAGDFSRTAMVHYEDYHDRQKFENLLINLANGTTLSLLCDGNGLYELYAFEVDHTTADTAVADLLQEARQLHTDKEKVILLNEWICEHLVYSSKAFADIDKIAGSPAPVEGNCASYACMMNYLCGRLGIPCILVFGESHCWNMIWADGDWGYTDASYNDLTYDHAGILLSDTPPKQPNNPDGNRFLMELLIPGSTK